jgi:hypothetical protein
MNAFIIQERIGVNSAGTVMEKLTTLEIVMLGELHKRLHLEL